MLALCKYQKWKEQVNTLNYGTCKVFFKTENLTENVWEILRWTGIDARPASIPWKCLYIPF